MNPKKVKQYILEKEQQYQTFRIDPNNAEIMWVCGDFDKCETSHFVKYGIKTARTLWNRMTDKGYKQYND